MFKIGDFSRFSRVSVKMLRHYDDLGLLKPARVDPSSGYRYYSANQLPRLNRIVALKDLGFRLEQIGRILGEELSVEQIQGMLKLRREELEQQMRELAEQLGQVNARLVQLEREKTVPQHDVVMRSIPPQMMAAIRQPVRVNGVSVADLFEELEGYIARFGARAPLPPLMIYHDVEYPESAEDIEVMVPVHRPLPTNGRIGIRELPGHETMACLIHTGRYDGLTYAFSVLLGWIEQNGFIVAGPTRELYLRFGADQKTYTLPEGFLSKDADEFVTELQIPVKSGKDQRENQNERIGGNHHAV